MIVKNESAIIHRLLQSVLPIIDFYHICDTGSTDNTIEMIEDYFRENRIPGKTIRKNFVNFGQNRSYALKCCETDMPYVDYILLMDADMILWLPPNFSADNWKKSLSDDAYYIYQGSDAFIYKNIRIIKMGCEFKYLGVTHEFIKSTLPDLTYGKFDKSEIFIMDIGDGGSKENKTKRDIELLLTGLNDEPNNKRYLFYLANSYRDSKEYDKAIETYHARISLGGWIEEIWQSYFNIGNCYKCMKCMPEAVYYWLEAYNVMPMRIENLYEIINHYRIEKKYVLAYHYFEIAWREWKKNNRDFLFLQNDVYDYKLLYELSIIGYYSKHDKTEISQICMNLFVQPNINETYCRNILKNYKYYSPTLCEMTTNDGKKMDKLMLKMKTCISDENLLTLNQYAARSISANSKFVSSTPSICLLSPTELCINVRYVNYKIDENGKYKYEEDTIHSKNIITVFEMIDEDGQSEWKQTKQFLVKHDSFHDNVYVGIEDIRLYFENNKLYYNANRGLERGKFVVEHGMIDISSGKTDSMFLKNENHCEDVEKNWVLYRLHNKENGCINKLSYIYSWYPVMTEPIPEKSNKDDDSISDISFEEDDFTNSGSMTSTSSDTLLFFKYIRGSTNGVVVDNEIWFICHSVSHESLRYYYHIFIAFDATTFELKKYTPFFTFEKSRIEYTLGFVYFEKTKELLVGYSVMDRTTQFIKIAREGVEAAFIHV
jgi:tetratricopeptide (TPR) repeat protein